MEESRKGMLLVISGPSGTGKGTLIEKIIQWDPSFGFSVSCTTRSMRPNEEEGKQYYFLDDARFDQLIQENAFLEYASVHGHRYGTLISEVENRIQQGKNVILDIDVQGGMAVMEKVPSCVSVFIYPPSFQILAERLRNRGTEKEEEICRRLNNARGECKKMDHYQYLLLNDTLEQAAEQLKCIITAEKMRSVRFFPVVPET